MRTAIAIALSLNVAMSIGSGCAGRARTRPAERPALEVLGELESSGTLLASDVYPLEAATDRTFLVISDDAEPVEMRQSASTTGEFKAMISVTESAPLDRTEFLGRDEAGNVVLTAVHDKREKAVTLFQPPLIVMPARLEAGASHTSSASMRVVSDDEQPEQRESGAARRTITYAADQRVRTSLGEFTAKRIDIRFSADLNLADASERTSLFVVAGHGVIAQKSIEEVKMLGLLGKKTERTLVLTGPSPDSR